MKPEARDSRGDNEHHEAKVAVFFFIDVFDDTAFDITEPAEKENFNI